MQVPRRYKLRLRTAFTLFPFFFSFSLNNKVEQITRCRLATESPDVNYEQTIT